MRQVALALIEREENFRFKRQRRLWGAPGESLRLQRSPDLRTWEDWQTTIGTDQPQEFIDETAGSRARQFYRAVSP